MQNSELPAWTINFALINTSMGNDLSNERLVEILSLNPREITNSSTEAIEEKSSINLTLFERKLPNHWTLDHRASKSKNYPHLKSELKGNVIADIHWSKSQLESVNKFLS